MLSRSVGVKVVGRCAWTDAAPRADFVRSLPRRHIRRRLESYSYCHLSTAGTRRRHFSVAVTQHSADAPPLKTPSEEENASTTTTQLVDALLQRTYERFIEPHRSYHEHVVAYSGGVDSSLAAALLHQVLSSADDVLKRQQPLRLVLGLSPAVSEEQRDQAREVAAQCFSGVPLVEVITNEGTDQAYVENNGQACFVCKTHLYTTLQAIVTDYQDRQPDNIHTSSFTLYNGTNADDQEDPTRVGLVAARQFHVASPLADVTKADVRRIARHLGLPNWNAAAAPCLRSRLQWGVPATMEHLEQIQVAERWVRQTLQLPSEANLRVRRLAQNRGRIEVDAEYVPEATTQAWHDHEAFQAFEGGVSVRVFGSGSVANYASDADKEKEPDRAGQSYDGASTRMEVQPSFG